MRLLLAVPAAVALLALASATLVQPLGCAQTSHYALVQALADGTARIDPYHERTCDDAYFEGHYYSNKAPGLAASVLPVYLVQEATGTVPASWRTEIWLLGLFGCVLPFAVLLVLVGREARVPAAVTLGAGTLLLPFSTLLFSHVLAACLAFASYVLLRRNLLLAGVLAGLAATTEYPVGLVAVALFTYVALTRGWRPAALYGAGGVAGLVPLLLFNTWAFGSPTHLSYRNVILNPGQSGHDVVVEDAGGIFGLRLPDPEVAVKLLLDQKGLLVAAPVLLVAAAGVLLLRRRDALLVAGLAVVFLLYNASFYVPFGGDVPGPRYLIPLLPFLALGLAPAYERWPGVTAGLAAVSVLTMALGTVTEPMLGDSETQRWVERAVDGDFTHTVVTFATGDAGWLEATPYWLLLAAAVALAARGLRIDWGAAVAVAAWAVAALITAELVVRGSPALVFAPFVAAAGVAAVALAQRRLSLAAR